MHKIVNGKRIELTQEEIDARILEEQDILIEQEYYNKNLKYKDDRIKNYPPIGDQLDALWHAMDDGILPQIEPLYTKIKNVKTKYKKPE